MPVLWWTGTLLSHGHTPRGNCGAKGQHMPSFTRPCSETPHPSMFSVSRPSRKGRSRRQNSWSRHSMNTWLANWASAGPPAQRSSQLALWSLPPKVPSQCLRPRPPPAPTPSCPRLETEGPWHFLPFLQNNVPSPERESRLLGKGQPHALPWSGIPGQAPKRSGGRARREPSELTAGRERGRKVRQPHGAGAHEAFGPQGSSGEAGADPVREGGQDFKEEVSQELPLSRQLQFSRDRMPGRTVQAESGLCKAGGEVRWGRGMGQYPLSLW